MFDSQNVAWADMSFALFGAKIKIRKISYEKEKEKEAIYTSGDDPESIQYGNNKYSGSVTVLKNQYDKMAEVARAAGFRDILDIPFQQILGTVLYRKGFGRAQQTDILQGISFTKIPKGMDQGAKMMEVELPFIFLKLTEK